MSKTLVLLPGWPKTGTSALQGWFNLNRAALAEQGICYRPSAQERNPRSEEASAGNAFELAMSLHPKADPIHRETIIRRFVSQAQASPAPWVIFSSEAFVGACRENLAKLAEAIQGTGMQVQVLFYLRSLPEFLLSQWRQRVKLHGEAGSVLDYVSRQPPPLRFAEAVRMFQEVWGAQVQVRLYDRKAFPQGNIIQDFLQALQWELDLNRFQSLPPQVNLRLNDWGTQIQRWVNEELHNAPLAGLFSRALLSVQPAAPSQGPSQELIDLIQQRFAGDQEYLKSLLPQWPTPVAALPVPELQWTEQQEQQARALARSLKGLNGLLLKAAYRLEARWLIAWLAQRWLDFCLGDQFPPLKQP